MPVRPDTSADTADATPTDPALAAGAPDVEAIIIGAGLSGLYQLYRLRELGMSVQLIEAGTGVGGTWYWNRYPGARFDSESYSYGFSFSEELNREWNWSEHFAPQPETLRYANFVADKFDLRRDIRFRTRVLSAQWQEASRRWVLSLDDGTTTSARFLVTAIGALSAPTLPRIEGRDSFLGQSCHTANWPHEPVSFEGKRVAVIGTGASGVQTIQEVAKTAAHLTVFQRTPNWCAPLHNGPITESQQREIKATQTDIFRRCRESVSGFIHNPDPRRTAEVSPEEREAFWEKRYGEPGFGIWVGNFRDILTDRAANALMSDFVARKIRQRVTDPAVAEKLIPRNHGFGTRRLPLETRYYEVYNQPNVELIDLTETPIECITPKGIQTTAREFEFDMIVYATGFDALTGAYDRMDIRGLAGQTLRDQWRQGARTFYGVQNAGFPNLLMVMGPMGALGNIPRSIEYNVEWVTGLLRHLRERGLTRVEAPVASVDEWMDVVRKSSVGLLANEVNSWMTGYNSNVEGRQTRVLARYSGTGPDFRARCDAVAAGGYRELVLD
jgi:cation diffusion facilitator CzcD-associated flavoprotein CzcO